MIPGGSRQLSFQVQLDVKDSTGRTALHCAASRGSQAVTRMLLDAWMHLDIPGLAGTFDDWKRKLNMILLNDFFLGGNLRNFVRVSSWIHLGGRFGDFEASSSDGSWCSEWLAVGRCVHEIWITTIACSLVLILAYMMLCIIVMYLMAGKFRWLGCEHEHPVKHWMIHPICWHQFQVVFTYSFRMFSRVQDTII